MNKMTKFPQLFLVNYCPSNVQTIPLEYACGLGNENGQLCT